MAWASVTGNNSTTWLGLGVLHRSLGLAGWKVQGNPGLATGLGKEAGDSPWTKGAPVESPVQAVEGSCR